MFDFVGRSRRLKAASALAAPLRGRFAAMHPVERAVVLVLANSLLVATGRARGSKVVTAPAGCTPAEIDLAVRDMASLRDSVVSVAEAGGDALMRTHANCTAAACDLVAASLVMPSEPSIRPGVLSAWKTVWESRDKLRPAVVWLRRREAATGRPVFLPKADGSQQNDLEIIRNSDKVPGFLRPAPATASSAAKTPSAGVRKPAR